MIQHQAVRSGSKDSVRRRIQFTGADDSGIVRYQIKSRTREDQVFHQAIDLTTGTCLCDCEFMTLSAVVRSIPVNLTPAHYEILCHHLQRAVKSLISAGALEEPTPEELRIAGHQIVDAKALAAEQRARAKASTAPTVKRTELVEEL